MLPDAIKPNWDFSSSDTTLAPVFTNNRAVSAATGRHRMQPGVLSLCRSSSQLYLRSTAQRQLNAELGWRPFRRRSELFSYVGRFRWACHTSTNMLAARGWLPP